MKDYRKKKGPSYTRGVLIKCLYGMTHERYEEMLKGQGGKCAICRTSTPGKRGVFAIDHCHHSGVVRGLLCNTCNSGIAMLGENPERLRAAAIYCEKFAALKAA